MVWVGRKLLVVGGWDGEKMLGDVWELESDAAVWTKLAIEVSPRACFGMGVLGDGIAVFGGLDNDYTLDERNETSCVGPNSLELLFPRQHLSERAITVGQPPAPRAFLNSGIFSAGP